MIGWSPADAVGDWLVSVWPHPLTSVTKLETVLKVGVRARSCVIAYPLPSSPSLINHRPMVSVDVRNHEGLNQLYFTRAVD